MVSGGGAGPRMQSEVSHIEQSGERWRPYSGRSGGGGGKQTVVHSVHGQLLCTAIPRRYRPGVPLGHVAPFYTRGFCFVKREFVFFGRLTKKAEGGFEGGRRAHTEK